MEIRSGESLYARELKSGAVEREFGSRAQNASSDDFKGREETDPATGLPTVRLGKSLVSTSKVSPATGLPSVTSPTETEDFTGRQRWVYQELRDRKVALFLDKLPEGVWQIRYDLRAEVPGEFHALPVVGHAMYVPEIRCNGQELHVKVTEAQLDGAGN